MLFGVKVGVTLWIVLIMGVHTLYGDSSCLYFVMVATLVLVLVFCNFFVLVIQHYGLIEMNANPLKPRVLK